MSMDLTPVNRHIQIMKQAAGFSGGVSHALAAEYLPNFLRTKLKGSRS